MPKRGAIIHLFLVVLGSLSAAYKKTVSMSIYVPKNLRRIAFNNELELYLKKRLTKKFCIVLCAF